ncbi:MAG: rhomboid family intramembrane serine protease [Reichenbachiella sp.]|uniref:rhomboid family intramembrane serine protease n=1 Tax=Reichenbachiella sp. TaxID=2184521 RepID=UPI002966B0DF|nr:rhomboid family intramembrane serine protease [Reichenbachiella sp.]MDW3211389.1 rhomboid family intramembrane serine protease [Reichenbachiella sp.]
MHLSTLPYQFLANFKNHIGTYLIIILNVISFGFQDHSFNVRSLLSEGANFAPYSLTNQPYRLISSVFLHGGFIHLIINLYNLYFVGKTVEEKVGVIQFLHLYFFYGITASIASCQFNLFTISVGASGAIFGSYAFLFLKEWNESNTQRKSLLINFIIFAFINTIFIRHLNIDVYAHLGGTLAGACSFILLQVFQKSTTSLLLWVLPIGLYFFIPNTQPQYYSAYNYTIQKDDHIRSALNSYYFVSS